MRQCGANPVVPVTRALRPTEWSLRPGRGRPLLGAARPEEVVFTLNATDSLNMAIKGVLEPGDHVIYTSMEHNSVSAAGIAAAKRRSRQRWSPATRRPAGSPDIERLSARKPN